MVSDSWVIHVDKCKLLRTRKENNEVAPSQYLRKGQLQFPTIIQAPGRNGTIILH